MNWERVQDQWKRFTGALKATWDRLTDDEVGVRAGRRTELLGKLRTRYDVLKAGAARRIDHRIAQMSAKHVRPDESEAE